MLACQQTAYPAPPEPASIPWDNIPILPEFCMELGHSLTDQNSFAARLLNAPGRAVRDRGIQHELAHWGPREEAGMAFRLGLGESKTVFETAGDSLYRFRRFR